MIRRRFRSEISPTTNQPPTALSIMHFTESEEYKAGHVMLDLETLGTKPGSVIFAIGAAEFSFQTGEISERFYQLIKPSSCIEAGLVIDSDTVLWWMQQNAEAREELEKAEKEGVSLAVALRRFFGWFPRCIRGTRVWGNGSDFDNELLESAYDLPAIVGIPLPWDPKRYNRCYKTVRALSPVKAPDTGKPRHHALHDAERQALHLMAMMRQALAESDLVVMCGVPAFGKTAIAACFNEEVAP